MREKHDGRFAPMGVLPHVTLPFGDIHLILMT